MRNFYVAAVIWVFTVGWWSIICPEFCMTNDCIQIVDETDKVIEDFDGKSDFFSLLNADSEEIEVKSKLLEYFKVRKEK